MSDHSKEQKGICMTCRRWESLSATTGMCKEAKKVTSYNHPCDVKGSYILKSNDGRL